VLPLHWPQNPIGCDPDQRKYVCKQRAKTIGLI